MNYNYYIADVFTRQLFNGAQIAVFPNADGLSNEQMQLLARELNLTEPYLCFILKVKVQREKCVFFHPWVK